MCLESPFYKSRHLKFLRCKHVLIILLTPGTRQASVSLLLRDNSGIFLTGLFLPRRATFARLLGTQHSVKVKYWWPRNNHNKKGKYFLHWISRRGFASAPPPPPRPQSSKIATLGFFPPLFFPSTSDSWPCHTSCRSILVGVWLEQEELRKFPRGLPCSQKAQGPSFGEHSAAGSHALPHIPPHKVSSKMLLATGTSFLMSLFPPGPNDRDRWISTCEASWLFLVTLSSYHSWDLPMLSLTNKWTIIIFATWAFVWIYPCTWQVFQPSNMNDGILTLGQGEEWGMATSLSSISIWEKGKLAHAHFCILVFQLYCPIPHQMDIQH